MRGAQFSDFTIFSVWRKTCLKIGYNNALVWHDLKEHIAGHNGRSEGTKVQQSGAACKYLVVAPRHDHKNYEQEHHERC